MTVVFVNYGLFNSNSGGHVAHFANALAKAGENVWVLGEGDPDSASEYGDVRFRGCSFKDLRKGIPPALLRDLREPGALVHGWTPRETVRVLVQRLVAEASVPYVIHLEDNEEVVARSQLGTSWEGFCGSYDDPEGSSFPPHLSHPVRSASLLSGAAGVTVITDTLREVVPSGLAVHLLEPGVDAALFSPSLSEPDRQLGRKSLYIEPSTKVLVYHGNMHSANRRDMFSLYTSIEILNRRGFKVVLIRLGDDHGDDFDASSSFLRRSVINLGRLSRAEMVATLQLADVYVQPGAADDFNIYRLPSKVPEFLALGKPVALPFANLGLRLEDGSEAVVLRRGDGLDIADQLERLFEDQGKSDAIGAAGRAFALRELDWDRNAIKLRQFYRAILDADGAGPREQPLKRNF